MIINPLVYQAFLRWIPFNYRPSGSKQSLKTTKFVYEDIKQEIDIVKPKDKIITLDVENGFYHIKVAPECSTYLGFTWRRRFYTWMVLPFGLNISPYYFCKTTRAVVHYLRQQGLRTVCYADDFLLCDSDEHIGASKKLPYLFQHWNNLVSLSIIKSHP